MAARAWPAQWRRWIGAVALATAAACSREAREPTSVDTDPAAIDLTTFRTGFADGKAVALDFDGPIERRRLMQTAPGTLTLAFRAPQGGELRYGLPDGATAGVAIRVSGAARPLAPRQDDATLDWRAPLDVPEGQLVELEFSATRPTPWIRPRIVGSVRETQPTLGGSLRPPPGPVNVILYVVDTLRASRLSTYGYARATSPRLTELARRGILFSNAYAAGAFTGPSVTALMSSRYPSELGCTLAPDGPAERTLAEVFRDAGFATAGFQANFLLTPEGGFARGFEQYTVLEDEAAGSAGKASAATLHARALEWVRTHGEKPFFLFLQSMDVHFPYVPPQPFRDMFYDATKLPDAETLRKLEASVTKEAWKQFLTELSRLSPDHYDGAIAYADHEIGQLLDAIERMGLADRTVVIVTADHGEPLGDRDEWVHGRSVFDELVRVPLIVRLPWHGGGMRVDDVVSLMDLAPTLADLARVTIPDQFVGRSLFKPVSITRPPTALGELVDSVTCAATGWFARQGDWKLIASPERASLYHLPSDPGESTDVSAAHGTESRYLRSLATARPALAEPRAQPRLPDAGLTEEQRRKRNEALRALGYIE